MQPLWLTIQFMEELYFKYIQEEINPEYLDSLDNWREEQEDIIARDAIIREVRERFKKFNRSPSQVKEILELWTMINNNKGRVYAEHIRDYPRLQKEGI